MNGKKYFDIKLERRFDDLLDIKPEDIMLLSRWMDMEYDHLSEFHGYYLGLIYLENGIPKACCFNSMEQKPFDDFFKMVKHVLVECDGKEWWCHTFFNQNMLKDLRSEDGILIYKDKYEIKSDYNGLYFSLPKSFKSLKYIKVRLENHINSNSRDYELVLPDDIIYLEHSFDTTYDYASENMGHFLTLIYLEDGEPVARFFNPGDWEPIGNLIEKSKDKLAVVVSGFMGGIFYNKNFFKDLRRKKNSMIFRDRYEFSPKDFIGFITNTLYVPGSFEPEHFKKYRSEYAKDPLKRQ